MRRIRTLLPCLALAATVLAIHPASAAESQPQACGGSAVLSTQKTLSLTGPAVTTSFMIQWNDGIWCPALSGTVTATCTSWAGSGNSSLNQRFQLTGQGATLVVTGSIRGTITLNYPGGIPCNGGGTNWVRGTGALTWG